MSLAKCKTCRYYASRGSICGKTGKVVAKWNACDAYQVRELRNAD